MIRKCWNADPSKRPAILDLGIFVDNKLEEIYKGKIDSSNNNINVSNDNSSSCGGSQPQAHKKHPLAYHTSRILDNEIAKSKSLSLKSNDSLLSDLDINSII